MAHLTIFRAHIVALVLGYVLAFAGSTSAQEIAQPPLINAVDQNGVNMATGKFSLPDLDIAVGTSSSGLARVSNTGSDNFSGIMRFYTLALGPQGQGPALADVSLGGQDYRFTVGNLATDGTVTIAAGPFLQSNGTATLACNGTPSTWFRDGTCTLTLGDGTTALYNQTLTSGSAKWGALQTVTKADGEIITLVYYQVGNDVKAIKSVSSTLGWMLNYQVDANYKVTRVTAFNSAVNYCAPTASSCSVNASFPYASATTSGGTTTIGRNGVNIASYTISGNTVTLTSPSSITKTVVYSGSDTSGKVSSVTVGGSTWTYTYGTGSTTAHAPNGATHSVTYSVSGITSATDELNRTTIYEYNYNGYFPGTLNKVIAPDGNDSTGGYTQYVYDLRGNVKQVNVVPKEAGTDTSQYLITTINYDATCSNTKTCNKPNYIIDAAGMRTDYAYDANGNLLSETKPAVNGVQSQTRYSYAQYTPHLKDSSGNLVAQPQVWRLVGTSNCMTANLNACANVNSTDEIKSSISYTSTNLLPYINTTMRGDGSYPQTTTLTYDDNGNTLVADGPKSGSVDEVYYFYDSLNRQIGSVGVDPDGSSGARQRSATRTDYDSDGRIYNTSIGTVATSVYSGSSAAARNSQAYADWQGMSVQSNDTTSYNGPAGLPDVARHYDNGTLTHLTQTNYDGLLRVNCVAQRLNPSLFGSITATNACTLGTAGPDGNDRISQYGYDNSNAVVSVTSGVGAATPRQDFTKTFDTTSGQLQAVTDANGNRTGYYYDSFDRLTKTCYPSATNGASINTSNCDQTVYAANGRIDHVVRRDGQTITFGYDAVGRVNSKSGATSESFAYDNFDDVASHTNNGVTSSFAYLSNGWLHSETEPKGTVSYDYDAYGKRTRLTWPDGFYVTYAYDDADELTGIYENGSTALVTFDYDNYGRRAHMYRANGQTTTYSYDTSSHLTGIGQGSANTISLAYTAADQIKTRTNSNGSFTYTPPTGSNSYGVNGLNRISTFNGTALSYDNRGNLASDGSGSYAYNVKNLLTSATQGGVTATLAYDAEDRLYSLSKNGTNTQFLYDGDDLIAEYNGSSLLRRYVFSPDSNETLVWYEGSGTGDRRFLLSDNLGSVTSVTNGSGSTLDINTYSAYGLMISSNSAYAGRFAYTGQVWLPEIGMYDYRARLYHPIIGRFMQTDPIGYGDGLNWYAYVHDDPINGSDPMGTCGGGSGMGQSTGNGPVDVTVTACSCPPGATCLSGQDAINLLQQMQNIDQNISDQFGRLTQAYNNWNTPSDPAQCAANSAVGAVTGGGIGAVAGGTAAAGLELTVEVGTGGVATVGVVATTPEAIAGGAYAGGRAGALLGGGLASLMSASCHNGGTSSAMSSGGGNGGGERKINPPKSQSPIWQALKRFKGDIKTDGTNFYKWDPLHNDIEVYGPRGNHLGSMDPETGEMYKDAVKGRKM